MGTPNASVVAALALIAPTSIALAERPASTAPFDTPWIGYSTASWPEGLYPYDGVTGDFNADGVPDLATVCFLVGSPHFSVLFGDGKGGYLPHVTYEMVLESAGVAALDWNNDGDLDLAISDTDRFFGGGTISIWDNDGGGAFTHFAAFLTGDSGPAGVVAADFDGDGWVDLATAHDANIVCNNGVSIMRNVEGSAFALEQFVTLASCTAEIDAGDVDGDGDIDLVVGHRSNRWSLVINGDAGFTDGGFTPGIPSGNLPDNPTIHLSDVDLDGDLDVFYSHQDSGGISQGAVGLWRNDGTGTLAGFGPAETLSFGLEHPGSVDVTTGDVTGDGWPDVFAICGVPTGANRYWFLFESDGTGGFGEPRKFRCGHRANSVHLSDLDVDGDLDATIVGAWSLEACVYLNEPETIFVQPEALDFASPAIAPAFTINVEAADLDADGDLDLVSGFRSDFSGSHGLTVRRNNGDGTFGPRETYPEPLYPVRVKVVDMDGDGDQDLLYFDASTRFILRLNDGAGNFGPRLPKHQFSIAAQSNEIHAADVDGDGDLDVGMNTGFFFRVSKNLGGTSFAAPYVAADLDLFTQTFAFGDYNEDGVLDLLTDAGSQVAAILLSLGDGTGDFGPPTSISTGERDVHSIGVADLDHDGHLDLTALYDRTPKGMTVRLGNGDGTFQPRQDYETSFFFNEYTPSGTTAIIDVDGDGFEDLLFANTFAQDFSYWRNQGDGTFEPQVRCGVGHDAHDLAVGDFNGDGAVDVAIATQTDADGQGFRAAVVIIDGLVDAPPSSPADIDADGFVGPADLGMVLAAWGPCPGCDADIDGDGVVGPIDLGILLANWG